MQLKYFSYLLCLKHFVTLGKQLIFEQRFEYFPQLVNFFKGLVAFAFLLLQIQAQGFAHSLKVGGGAGLRFFATAITIDTREFWLIETYFVEGNPLCFYAVNKIANKQNQR